MRLVACRSVAVVAAAVLALAPAAVADAEVPPDEPTIEVRGETVPLDGRALPDDLTAGERAEAFAAADAALSEAAQQLLATGEGPDWLPLEGTVELWCTQSNGGYAGCAGHHDLPAIDIGVPEGTPVFAAGPAMVTDTGDGGGRGNFVDLGHPSGISSHYLHLSQVQVRPGDVVVRGQQIGLSGSTGSSSAPHLHYEERGPDGTPVPIGPMLGQVGDEVVSYPQGPYGLDWPDVPYGTLLRNDGYRTPVSGDLDGDGRPERATGSLVDIDLGVSATPGTA